MTQEQFLQFDNVQCLHVGINYIGASLYQNSLKAMHWWLTPAIPATWEAEIRRILVGG
jgi:hypothetical protein